MVASHKRVIDNLKDQIHFTDTLREGETAIHEAHLAKARTVSQTGNEWIRHGDRIGDLNSRYWRLGEELKRVQAKNKQELARFFKAMGLSANGQKL